VESVALLDGKRVPLAEAALAITDDGAARGDGAFESVGVWGGAPFRLDDHLRRLAASLAALRLPAPDLDLLTAEATRLVDDAAPGADAMLRVYVTAAGTRLLYVAPQPDRPAPVALIPQPAPWIRPLGTYGPAGAKSMSYAANMAATRAARADGGDDALLVALEGWVLEGPTFTVLWVADGRLHAPALDLGIVDSVSRRALLELTDLEVAEGRWILDDLARASEVVVCSAVRAVVAVRRVGEHSFGGATLVRDRLSAALDAARRGAAR
jgi:branched-subunit amino acid aminotransferase/4-amino-4-deoxychorismate lyase